jgi:RNA recognition motif-containing protein
VVAISPSSYLGLAKTLSRGNQLAIERLKYMATKLFVGKLSFDTTDETLRAAFAQYGAVTSAQVIMDRDTNRSKGFGFVEMENDQEAQAAIAALNEQEFEGRTIVVNVARPREDRPQRSGGGGGGNFRGGFQRR